jgi:diacylglycerol kinase (ATP)
MIVAMASPHSTVHVFGNDTAGVGRAGAVASSVCDLLRSRGYEAIVVRGNSAAAARSALAAALANGAQRVIAVGGDGTLHAAVAVLAGQTAVKLGIVPSGTGNDTAAALGIDTKADLATAVDRALGEVQLIDLMNTGPTTDPIVSVATAGFSVDVNKRANAMRWPRGGARYNLATVAALPGMRPRPTRIVVDGVVHEHRVVLLAVGNTTSFGGGMRICPTADPTDGLLDVTIIGEMGRVELLRVFPTVFTGKHVSHRAVTTLRGREIRIDGTGDLWGDGEPVTALPVTLTAQPGALAVAGVSRTN